MDEKFCLWILLIPIAVVVIAIVGVSVYFFAPYVISAFALLWLAPAWAKVKRGEMTKKKYYWVGFAWFFAGVLGCIHYCVLTMNAQIPYMERVGIILTGFFK